MKRSELRRKKRLERETSLSPGRPLKKLGRRAKRDRLTGAVFGPLSDFARDRGCQARPWCPPALECGGKIEACHARSRGAGYGDWYEESGGLVVGNVFGACHVHHAYADTHKATCLPAMRAAAWYNGLAAIKDGIEPVL